MKKILFLLFFAGFCWNISAQRGGDLETRASRKYAVVSGNPYYAHRPWGPLNNAKNDADDIESALKSLGFIVYKLINGNLEQMKMAVMNLKRDLGRDPNSFGVFYYSGHGYGNYLIPTDANISGESEFPQQALSLEFVLAELEEAGNILNVIILDACRTKIPFARSGIPRGGYPVTIPTGTFIAYATKPGEIADEGYGQRNGRYTGQLLKHIRTPGLDINELFDRTANDVITASGGTQIPEVTKQFFRKATLGGGPVYPSPVPSPQPSPPQPYNPLVGTWRASITTNSGKYEERLTCNLTFWPDGTITVGNYDTNIMTYKTAVWLWWWYANDIRRGSGKGTYRLRDNGNSIAIDIVLSLSGVSWNFTEINAVGTLNKNNPGEFTVSRYTDPMKCEYKDGAISDAYRTFTKM